MSLNVDYNTPTVLNVLIERIQNLKKSGKFEDAIRAAETAVESARRLIEDRPDQIINLVTCLELLGNLLRICGKEMESEAVYVEALSYEGSEKIEMRQLARIKSNLACIYDNNNLNDEAIILYNQAIDTFSSLTPSPEIEIANIRNNLGMLHKKKREFEVAENNYMIALQAFENNKGATSEEAAAVYNNLGTLFYDSELINQSREMHEQALEILIESKKSNNSDLGQSYSNLAASLEKLGETDAAEKNYELALGLLETTLKDALDIYEITCENYCNLLIRIGKKRRAASVQKKALKLTSKIR
ncbi:MAG: tetratricopeptide repeat protein [Verrucomicrobiota bacterium]|nr:tetratricopeptide repeat protein [Verrucomicrobiota bacterium]